MFPLRHRSLNEYCAAAALNRQNEAGFKLISGQLGNPAWRQVIFFYAAIDNDNDNAVRLVETIQQRAVEESDSHLLALAGHCAAVMVQPRTSLRLKLLDTLTKALLAVDLETRPVLLKSLLALGNSRDTAIRQRLDSVMRQFVESGRVEELLRDVVERLETTTALQFLAYLAESGDLWRKRMAVWGLAQLQHLDTIPFLWRLLLDFRSVGETDSERLVIKPLLGLMADPGAVECLNACEPKPVAPNKTMQQRLLDIYPFQPAGQSIVNFAWLLDWTSKVGLSPGSIGETGSAWRQFVDLIMSDKNAEELREWKRLPGDKNKRTLIVQMVVIGRWLFWFPLTMSFVLIYIMFRLGIHIADDILRGIALNIILCIVLLLIWRVWEYTLTRWGWLGTLEAFPPRIKRWLLGNRSLDTSLLRRMRQGISLNLKRAYFFGWAILLLAPAEFLNNPSISGHESSTESLTTNHASHGLLTKSSDRTVRLFDSKTGTQLRRFDHDKYIHVMALDYDGKAVLTGLYDGTVRLWNSNTGTQLLRLKDDKDELPSSDVSALAFSPDGTTLLTGSSDKTARLWDSKTGKELWRFQHDNAIGSIIGMAFTPDGQGIYAGSIDGVVGLWKSHTGELIWQTPTPFWNDKTWTIRVFYIWVALIFMVFFLPCLN